MRHVQSGRSGARRGAPRGACRVERLAGKHGEVQQISQALSLRALARTEAAEVDFQAPRKGSQRSAATLSEPTSLRPHNWLQPTAQHHFWRTPRWPRGSARTRSSRAFVNLMPKRTSRLSRAPHAAKVRRAYYAWRRRASAWTSVCGPASPKSRVPVAIGPPWSRWRMRSVRPRTDPGRP